MKSVWILSICLCLPMSAGTMDSFLGHYHGSGVATRAFERYGDTKSSIVIKSKSIVATSTNDENKTELMLTYEFERSYRRTFEIAASLVMKTGSKLDTAAGAGKADCIGDICFLSATIKNPSPAIKRIEISDWFYFDPGETIRRTAYVDIHLARAPRIVTFGIREKAQAGP